MNTALLNQLVKHFKEQGPLILLESQSDEHPESCKNFLAAQPRAEIKARGNDVTIHIGKREIKKKGNPWKALQEFRDAYSGDLFGYLGYDLKNHLEDLQSGNCDPVKAPDMYFMQPGFLLEWDHQNDKQTMHIGDMPVISPSKPEDRDEKFDFRIDHLEPQITRKNYLRLIREAQQRIKEGNFYEINLSHQMKGDFRGSTFDLYRVMKQAGPVPFGAYLNINDVAVCCQSPERFLRKEGEKICSQPIKGTAERHENVERDKTLRKVLSRSEKEQAENLMIVDLVRNDLNKIARRGSVKVPRLFEIQSFKTVHQMVSTVEAEVERKADPVNILKACFPMGSMTGAPKISVMNSIEELEQYRRGIYSGAIGYITANGDFDFNVVIRTAIIANGELFYAVGGAITGDSDPKKEWDETLLKARALSSVII